MMDSTIVCMCWQNLYAAELLSGSRSEGGRGIDHPEPGQGYGIRALVQQVTCYP